MTQDVIVKIESSRRQHYYHNIITKVSLTSQTLISKVELVKI
jgi:hypothetical protein